MILVEETDNRFYIVESTLPNAGFGCFAKELIEKGSHLEIIGVMVKNDGIADRCTHYAKRYKFAGSKLDAKIVPMGYAGMVNHTDDKTQQNVEIRRIPGLRKRSPHASEVVYQATRDILPGEELLGYYGDDIDGEIKKLSANLSFHEENKMGWDKFLAFDLYGLKELSNLFVKISQ